MRETKTNRIAYLGMLIALAFIFSYIEALIPFHIAIPGIKLGLANIVIVIALYTFGIKDAFIISMVRIVLIAFTFSNTFTMIYSLAGGLLSWAVMSLLKQSNKLSIIGVSVAGGVAHNIGQLTVAAILMETSSLIYYLPLLIIGAIITGIIIGLLSRTILKTFRKYNK